MRRSASRLRVPVRIGSRAMRGHLSLIFLFSILIPNSNPAIAAPASGDCPPDSYFLSLKIESKCESQHHLSLGAGVSSPSVVSTFTENPAGFIYNQKIKAHASVSKSTASSSSPWRYSVMGLGGNGSIGGGAGVHRYRDTRKYRARTGSTVGTNVFSFGFAKALDFLNTAIGYSGSKALQSVATAVARRDSSFLSSNLGVLIAPKNKVRAGFTAFNAFSSIKSYGFGLSSNSIDNLAVAVDGIFSQYFKPAVVKASLGTTFSNFEVSLGYGLSTQSPGDANPSVSVPTGFSAGVGVWFGSSLRLLATYNQIEAYYLGLTVSL